MALYSCEHCPGFNLHKHKTLILVMCLMKLTRFFILCHKILGLPSSIILVLFGFILMSTSPNRKLKPEKIPLKWNTFISLSAHDASAMAETVPKTLNKHSEICRKFETLIALEQQLTVYIYTCLSHVLWNLQNNSALYIFTYYKLCIILSFLCSTAYKVPLRSLAMQQTGPLLHGKKFTHMRVSSV